MTRTLLTGANGFLGKYIQDAFHSQKPLTLGLTDCLYNIDLSASVPEFNQPFDKVIHSAGLAHLIQKTKKVENRFYDVNLKGTLNLLKGLEKLSRLPRVFIFISTVAVYGKESGEMVDESHPLNGNSPYAKSKADAENEIIAWGKKNNVKVLILRLPLIAGKNPPGNLGSMINAIKKGYYFRIGDGDSRKSIVLASEVATFVASCGEISGIYNLTDGVHPTIRELDTAIASRLNKTIKQVPEPIVRNAAKIGDFLPIIPISTSSYKKLTSSLTFSDEKARREIGWKSRPVIDYLEI